MTPPRILVVEDERIISRDICDTLDAFGYKVAGVESAGPDAIKTAMLCRPDLILMDIMLEGEMDGIETAEAIRDRIDVPVVYLTAYADERIVQRAKLTGPLGYIVKPFDRTELRITVEMALYKHQLDGMLKDSREQFRALLETAGAIPWEIGLPDWNFTYMGPQAERVTGYPPETVVPGGLAFWESVVMPDDREAAIGALRATAADREPREIEYRLMTASGSVIWLRQIINHVAKGGGLLRGFIFDITARKLAELERERLIAELQGALAKIKTLRGLLPICAWCKKIRDDQGYWSQVEEYIQSHSDAEFTHGMCPDCQKRLESELSDLEGGATGTSP